MKASSVLGFHTSPQTTLNFICIRTYFLHFSHHPSSFPLDPPTLLYLYPHMLP